MPLTTVPFGPFVKGVTSTRNPSLDPQTALRSARNWLYTGVQSMTIRPGTQVALSLFDDGVPPSSVQSVRAISPFMDGSLAIAWSQFTQKVYLYRLDATLTGWYDATGVFHADHSPEPVGVLWTGVTVPPDVMIAEGLGTAYIANTGAADVNGLYYPSKTYDGLGTIADLLVNGTGGVVGTDVAYFSGVVSFNQHLWAWGYGAGSTPGYTSYRPELARFSQPNFDPFQTVDSITLGDRVRTLRERIIAGVVIGDSLYLMGDALVTRVTGDGRDSWFKKQVDQSYGVVGPKAAVRAGDYLYYWCSQGPIRIAEDGAPDPLWDAIPDIVATVANQATIVAGFDRERNQVLFFFDTGNFTRTFCAFDIRRNVWLGPDADIGLPIACAGLVEPVFASTVVAPIGPTAPPIAVSTTMIGSSTATANWTNGDPTSPTEISYRIQSGVGPPNAWTVLPVQSAGVTSYMFSDLTPGLLNGYEWRVRHVKNGQYSAYSGPNTNTQFHTLTALNPPTHLSASLGGGAYPPINVSWTNSGDAGVSTQVYVKLSADTNYTLANTAAVGVSSTTIFFGNASAGTRNVRIRHIKGANTSAYVGPVNVG